MAACASFLASLSCAPGQEAATSTNAIQPRTSNSTAAPGGSPSGGLLPASWMWGNLRGYVTFTAQLRYDDNILQTDQHAISDLIAVGIPSLNMEYIQPVSEGSILAHVDYAPQFVAYLSHAQYDAIDQLADAKLEETRHFPRNSSSRSILTIQLSRKSNRSG